MDGAKVCGGRSESKGFVSEPGFSGGGCGAVQFAAKPTAIDSGVGSDFGGRPDLTWSSDSGSRLCNQSDRRCRSIAKVFAVSAHTERGIDQANTCLG